ncbi:hypothetical protein EC957_002783 [Mortierella hygrophila]|uniref:Uncharacterized protein n=1 Tax=Mortierella hygrophila TaxID=979708 RepID=A0A9P6FFP0_9FUNG|nr:hypothetical protein EC957_002783 [Mortierella hygrophila]
MLARVKSQLGQTPSYPQTATSEPSTMGRKIPNGDANSAPSTKEPSHNTTYSSSSASGHRYQSFSSVKDDSSPPKGSNEQSKPSRTVQQVHQQSESRKGSNSFAEAPQDRSFRTVTIQTTAPRAPMRTSLTLLDTSASSMSNSILSRTRRASDRKMRQHLLEIQRDMTAPSTQQQPFADDIMESSSRSTLGGGKPVQDSQPDEGEASRNMEAETTDIKGRASKYRQPSSLNRSISFLDSTSPTTSFQQEQGQYERSGSTAASNRHSQSVNASHRSSSSRQLRRVLSGPIFIPNPRGIAPTPSPDASMELVRKPLHSATPPTKPQTESQLVSKDQLFRHSQKQLRLYEDQLDARIQTVQVNNQRLQALKSLVEDQGRALTIRTIQHEDDEDSEYDEVYYDDEDEEEEQLRIESSERAEERLQLEETKALLEKSLVKQKVLDEQLVQERSRNKELESKIEGMSHQVKGVLEMDMAQAKEIDLVHEQAVKDREQWEELLRQEKQKREELQMTMEAELAVKDRQLAETSAKERLVNGHENQALAAQVASLNQELEELTDRMRRNESKAQSKLDQQEDQTRKHKERSQELERQLEQERNRQADDQENRMDDLIEEVEEKEQDVQDLRAMLAEYDDLLQSRQSELNEAMELVQSLQDQLQDHQVNHTNDLQLTQDQHKKELKRRQADIRELKRDLTQEKEASHEHQKRIELLLASHQETTQLHEGKIRDLQEELVQRNSQLSLSKSTATNAIKKAKGHLETIDLQQRMVEEQEQILLEKEGRIEELEQELKEAQQRHHTVVADMEQDLRSLEQERAELIDMVKLARQQGMEDRDDEVSHGIELERQMLERVLDELDPDFRVDSQQLDGSLDVESGEGRRTVSQLYVVIQDKIREQKQQQLDLVMEKGQLENKLAEQREQLDECEAEIESQHEQLLRLEQDRLELEDQHIRLREDFAIAQEDTQRLRQLLQEKDTMRSSRNVPMSGRASTSASRQLSTPLHDDGQVRALFDKVSILEQEKSQLLDSIKSLEESVSDLTEAGRTLRDKYEGRVATLRQELVMKRQLVIRQEGQLFLYLSVIEKLKLALRDAKIEPPRDTKVEPPQVAKVDQEPPN